MEDMHQILEELQACEADGVLATVIHVEGSAYKKEGACMFFRLDGSRSGLLSAGCLEEDLEARISQGLGSNPEVIVYDMKGGDEFSWGEGSGCNGLIHVLVEPVNKQMRSYYKQLQENLNQGKSVTMIKQIAPFKEMGEFLYISEDGHTFGTWEKADLPSETNLLISEVVNGSAGNGRKHLFSSNKDVYVHHYEPKPRLIVFGAGMDAVPLVGIATQAGFSVTVSDWRPALCNENSFPTAARLIVDFPVKALSKLDLHPRDFVVILTHNFQKDKELLSVLKDKKFRYLGILGSEQRAKRVLGVRELPDNVISPIGLSIHAEGPEEIAISIVAELIKVRKESRPMIRAVCS
ncbi:XdhC family protein [Sediminibacillus massiliensis]|uniref:XdhC family protein n=1 Tax=Sediminibacillus massiliensis TaxID=1926277 RepID=UPI0009886A22|nr:XdhC/CoxI family protein [Sediminibacillus massiliensis]